MLRQLKELSDEKGMSPAQLSMAWLLHKAAELGVSCLPIPGTANLSHALDNIASAQVVLELADMTLLEEIGSQIAGARESDGYLKMRVEGQTSRL